MRRIVTTIAVILLALGAVEGISWWWMNPPAAGTGEPVLAYRPEIRDQESGVRDQETGVRDQESGVGSQEEAPAPAQDHAQSSHPIQKSNINNHQSSISSSSTTHTPLPEIYRQAAPMLRCTSGQVFHVQISDTASLHGAFFEWDGTDTGSVLEAFRHMPEACMGSIGMELVSKEKPIAYTVTAHTLLFDHTVFRDPGQGRNPLVPLPLVHAFRAVWVSGTPEADARSGLDGRGFDQLRTIRLNSALTRYRPRNARVIQGAVRGLHPPEAAWAAFEEHMLRHLTFER